MNFAEIHAAQWNGYSERHQNKLNLLIHIVTVPLVWLAAVQILGGLLLMLIAVGGLKMWFYAALWIAIALFAQAYGNSLEASKPKPAASPMDFAINAAVEQFLTFPRFVLTGQWLRNLQGAG